MRGRHFQRVIHLLTLFILCSNPIKFRRCEAHLLPTPAETQNKQVLGPFDVPNDLSVSRRQEMLREIRAFLLKKPKQASAGRNQKAELHLVIIGFNSTFTRWPAFASRSGES
jgi:hypothetical protein